jgi:ketosteroid isomerase-like protein
MSQQSLELIGQLYGWLADGAHEKAFEVYAGEIEWDCRGAPWLLELGSDPVYLGHDGVRRALRGWFEAWDSIDDRPTELIDAGHEVLAFVRVAARGRASGAEVSYEHGQLWTLRDGMSYGCASWPIARMRCKRPGPPRCKSGVPLGDRLAPSRPDARR